MAEEKLSDVIAGLIYCALKPESLSADDFHRYMDAYNQVREWEERGENGPLTVSKIDTPESTPGAVQNGHKKGVASWRRAVLDRVMNTRFSSQQIAKEADLSVDELRAFINGISALSTPKVKAISDALDRLEGRG